MADAKTKGKKIDRTYVIPVRRLSIKVAKWRKAKKSMAEIRKFMKRHMKCENIKVGQELNEVIWQYGGKSVVPRVEVHAVKEDDIVYLNLIGCELPKKVEVKEEKKEEKKVVKEAPKKEATSSSDEIKPRDDAPEAVKNKVMKKVEEIGVMEAVKEVASEIKKDQPEAKPKKSKKKKEETANV